MTLRRRRLRKFSRRSFLRLEEVARKRRRPSRSSRRWRRAEEDHLGRARLDTTRHPTSRRSSRPPSSPVVGHAAHDALAMTPETLRVVAMVTCAALLSGYTIAITVFSLAFVMNAAAAAAAAAARKWRAAAVWGARGRAPEPAEAVRCVMRGAFSGYPPGLARLVLAAEAALGDARRRASRRGRRRFFRSLGRRSGRSRTERFESPTAFEDSRIVTLTWGRRRTPVLRRHDGDARRGRRGAFLRRSRRRRARDARHGGVARNQAGAQRGDGGCFSRLAPRAPGARGRG